MTYVFADKNGREVKLDVQTIPTTGDSPCVFCGYDKKSLTNSRSVLKLKKVERENFKGTGVFLPLSPKMTKNVDEVIAGIGYVCGNCYEDNKEVAQLVTLLKTTEKTKNLIAEFLETAN